MLVCQAKSCGFESHFFRMFLSTKLFKSIEVLELSYFFVRLEKQTNIYYTYWNTEYSFLLAFMVISFLLTCVLFLIAFVLSSKSMSFEKGSPYECGFEPFGSDAHSVFNIQYFVVGILFMIFDLELAYLFS